MGQKTRALKHSNDNNALFQNKTADADLRSSFQVQTPKKLVNSFEKLDLVQDTPFVRPAIKAQIHSSIDTPSDTFTNLNRNTVRKINFKPALPLSTKRALYNNKENVPEQSKEKLKNLESIILPQSNISTASYSITVKENDKEIANKLPVDINDDTCHTSLESTKFNYDTSLYHSVRETTSIPESYVSFAINKSNSLVNSSLSTKKLECRPLDDHPKNPTIELTPIVKSNNVVVCAQSSTRPTTDVFYQEEDLKLSTLSNLSGSVCIKCANENFISVKGIKYSILNTLGHGGSSIVYEVPSYKFSFCLYFIKLLVLLN